MTYPPQPPAPAPAPAPAPPAPPPVPAPAPQPAAPQAPAAATPPAGDAGFPANTPLEQMTPEQREAYWKHYARKHEQTLKDANVVELQRQAQELAALKAATQTDQDKALQAARAEGRTAALREAGTQIVDAHLAAATATILTPEQRDALLAPLDRGYFLAADGVSVDTAKISAFVAQLPAPAATATPPGTTPATGQRLDMGQGRQSPPAGRPSGIDAGREIARKRFGPKPGAGAPAA